ncbi:hypothetical protein [Candidatus Nitrotoga fabula]|uniref:hypothetical protein n=1 Tax=Candidatus Nitrotoga fabula TaxID=2182327 RepID=UPI001BB474E8|nr:hypothetical protein [Candidatus Nitrotoga fabula]
MERLAEQSVYIRVGGGQFRTVSIHPENPCGRLKRPDGGKIIGGTTCLDTALNNARVAAPANTVKPGNNKPEHVVQAGLAASKDARIILDAGRPLMWPKRIA